MREFNDFFKKNINEDGISTSAFSTPSASGGSPIEKNTPSNYVGTQGKGKKRKEILQKRPFPQGDKSPEKIPNGQRTVGSAV